MNYSPLNPSKPLSWEGLNPVIVIEVEHTMEKSPNFQRRTWRLLLWLYWAPEQMGVL